VLPYLVSGSIRKGKQSNIVEKSKMGILHELMNALPHMEFETPELKQKYTSFMETLDRDMDSAGFDTDSNTDDQFDALKEYLDDLENDIVLEFRSTTDEEQEAIDKLTEELEDEESDQAAVVNATVDKENEEDAENEEEAVVGVIVTEEVIATVDVDEDETDEFEQELQAEVAEQERLEEIKKAATGESDTQPQPSSNGQT
jgi:hypothetical protein